MRLPRGGLTPARGGDDGIALLRRRTDERRADGTVAAYDENAHGLSQRYRLERFELAAKPGAGEMQPKRKRVIGRQTKVEQFVWRKQSHLRAFMQHEAGHLRFGHLDFVIGPVALLLPEFGQIEIELDEFAGGVAVPSPALPRARAANACKPSSPRPTAPPKQPQ